MIKLSSEIDQIQPALVKACSEMTNPEKNCSVRYKNTQFKYADLGACIEACKSQLLKHGITPLQDASLNKKETHYVFQTLLLHSTGQFIESVGMQLPVGHFSNSQDYGGVRSYGCRYQLNTLLLLFGEDDPDGPEQKAGLSKEAIQKLEADLMKLSQEKNPQQALEAVTAYCKEHIPEEHKNLPAVKTIRETIHKILKTRMEAATSGNKRGRAKKQAVAQAEAVADNGD